MVTEENLSGKAKKFKVLLCTPDIIEKEIGEIVEDLVSDEESLLAFTKVPEGVV